MQYTRCVPRCAVVGELMENEGSVSFFIFDGSSTTRLAVLLLVRAGRPGKCNAQRPASLRSRASVDRDGVPLHSRTRTMWANSRLDSQARDANENVPCEIPNLPPKNEMSPTSHQISFEPTLSQAREAVRSVARFLAQHGLDQQEVFDCELALAEACNNAVQHAGADGRNQPISILARCADATVELRVTDHTPGFDWPESIPPPEPEIEKGRGLYLIQAMMDGVRYIRGTGENTLILQKNIAKTQPPI